MGTKVNDFKVGDWVVFTMSRLDHHTRYTKPPFDGAAQVTSVRPTETYPIRIGALPLEYDEVRHAKKNEIHKTPKKLKAWKL